jgi:hypothetical protein
MISWQWRTAVLVVGIVLLFYTLPQFSNTWHARLIHSPSRVGIDAGQADDSSRRPYSAAHVQSSNMET